MIEYLIKKIWCTFIFIGKAAVRLFRAGGINIKQGASIKLISLMKKILIRLIPDRIQVKGIKLSLGTAAQCKINDFEYVVGYEEFAVKTLKNFLMKGDCFVDIGAHIGYFSLLAAKSVGPKGRVYAFEPAPDNFARFVENVKVNDCDNIICIQKGVSDIAGSFDFKLDKRAGFNSLHLAPNETGKIKVDVTTLDDFFDMIKWPPVSFIKIDAQGEEGRILKGAKKFLQRNPNVKMIIEWWPEGLQATGCSPQSFIKDLYSFGFKLSVIDEEFKRLLPADSFDLLSVNSLNLLASVNLFCRKDLSE